MHRRDKLVAALKAGGDWDKLAETFGYSIGTVATYASALGVRRPRQPGLETYTILAELINTRDTHVVIAKRHRVTRQWVDQVWDRARRAGIRTPARRRALKTERR